MTCFKYLSFFSIDYLFCVLAHAHMHYASPIGTLDDYANWRAWIRMDHKVALMDPSRYGRLDQVSGLLMLAKRTSSNHTNLVYPRQAPVHLPPPCCF
jgi:hypothetical protein